MIILNFNSKLNKVKKFNIHQNGIQLLENKVSMEFRVDVFRTQPLFLFKDHLDNLYIFDDMNFFNSKTSFKRKIDTVGFWEIMLFGTSLWTRTLYQNLTQLPGATSLKVNKKTKKFSIKRYWDFNVKQDKKIQTIDDAAKILDKKLSKISKNLDKSKSYILGLSGGLDARITLAYISKFISKEKIKLFTYANSTNSLEFKISKKICERLNLNKPDFHLLTLKSYKDALEYLPEKSGGQISINHCHIIDFLKNNSISDQILLSSYFSDAIFGWECKSNLSEAEKNFNPYEDTLDNCTFLDSGIKNQIRLDSRHITKDYDRKSNISSLKEYIYITERNQKFHNYLFNIQKDFSKNNFDFYNNYDLFKFSLSIPHEFKHHKKIEYYMLEKYFNKISHKSVGDISSNKFFRSNKSISLSKFDFKFRNRLNALLRKITNGLVQIENKYQTEELEKILYYFKKELIESFKLLSDMKVLDKKHEFLKSIPISPKGTNKRYILISIAKLFK